MKQILSFFLLLLVIATTGFAENLVLDNQTSYPAKNQKGKIAVQWASSAKDVDEGNDAIINGSKLNSKTVRVLTQTGTINLKTPKSAEYFRVLVWSKGDGEPDLHTNWVDIVPNKTYTLQTDHLVPSVLMQGSGC